MGRLFLFTNQQLNKLLLREKSKNMDHLPLNDTPMLVSAINFLLRDEEFDTLDEICFHFNVNRDELEQRLASEGFQYSEEQKRFI